MDKFYGIIGYGNAIESASRPGVYVDDITEKAYYGDVLRLSRRIQTADKVNDNVNISNEISIVADPYAYEHFQNMRYVVFMGAKWKITNVEVKYPRLVLSIGDLYNEEKT